MEQPVMNIDQFHSFAGGLDHPECVAWGQDGNVYAGGEGGQIYRITPDRKPQVIANTGGFILGVTLDGDNNIYASDVAQHIVFKITAQGQMSKYSTGSPDRALVSPNFALFDRFGYLYYTDSGIAGQYNSCLFRARPGGQTEMVSDEVIQQANGLALSPDGKYLYIALTEENRVVRVSLPKEPDGPVGKVEPVVSLERAVVDGLAMDSQGNLYIPCYSPDRIYRYTSGGRLEIFLDDWKRSTLASPTNLAWGGNDWRTLFAANFARWDIAWGQVETPGCAPYYPKF